MAECKLVAQLTADEPGSLLSHRSRRKWLEEPPVRGAVLESGPAGWHGGKFALLVLSERLRMLFV